MTYKVKALCRQVGASQPLDELIRRLIPAIRDWCAYFRPGVVDSLGAGNWRVRDVAAKVCLARELGEAADDLAGLLDDPVPRVRAAAARAVGEAEHAPLLRRLLTDDDSQCRARAEQALRALATRLDGPL